MQWLKGEGGAPSDGGTPACQEAVLKAAPVGARVFLLQFGDVTDEVIAKYIAEQNIDQVEDLQVDG